MDNTFGQNGHISVGLSEIALEEIGKSFSCLAYCSISDQEANWDVFWQDWRKHDAKAHRAFLYEFFCLLRIEFDFSDDYIPSKRKRISLEKEASLYVDFDNIKRKPIIPIQEIEENERLNRVGSVIGPLNAALKVQELMKNKQPDYKKAFYDYAFYVLTQEVYQQQVTDLLKKLKKGIEEYDKALDDILLLFTPNSDN